MNRFHAICIICGMVALVSASRSFGEASTWSETPCWFPLGKDVYQEFQSPMLQGRPLKFLSEPRWFETPLGRPAVIFPKVPPNSSKDLKFIQLNTPKFPKTLEDIPTDDRGASLALAILPTKDAQILVFRLTLRSENRELFRELEHRCTNVTPFLFAFRTAKGFISIPPGGYGRIGGINYLDTLVKPGKQMTWDLAVETSSILELLPTETPEAIDVIATFCERQHSPNYAIAEVLAAQAQLPEGEVKHDAAVCVHSNMARICYAKGHLSAMDSRSVASANPGIRMDIPFIFKDNFVVTVNKVTLDANFVIEVGKDRDLYRILCEREDELRKIVVAICQEQMLRDNNPDSRIVCSAIQDAIGKKLKRSKIEVTRGDFTIHGLTSPPKPHT